MGVGTRQPHARVAGRAAHPGTFASFGGPSPAHRGHREPAGAAARRRVQRARRTSRWRVGGASRWWSDAHHHRGRAPAWRARRLALAGGRRSHRRGGMNHSSDEPVPLADALAAVRAELGLSDGLADVRLEREWPEIVGTELAAHARPQTRRDAALVLVVDSSVWPTELRHR